MCRSLPQIAVDVIRTIASRAFRILGSGTSSTRMSAAPYQHVALMSTSLLTCDAVQQCLAFGTTGGLPFGGGNFAGLQKLLEAAQILREFQFRFFANQPDEQRAHPSSRRAVVKRH